MTSPVRSVFTGLSTLFAVGAVGALALPVSAAQANLLGCTPSTVSPAFAPWGDSASYALVPGGDFESSAWSLQGAAHRVAGSDPYARHRHARLMVAYIAKPVDVDRLVSMMRAWLDGRP